MEVGSLQHLSDSFSYGWLTCAQAPPSFECVGSPRPSSFMDDDPAEAELFSMRWSATSDFDFGLPRQEDEAGAAPPSPKTLVVSASQIFRGGRLLPSSPAGSQEEADGEGPVIRRALDASASTSPLFLSAQSTPVSMSSCSSARNSSTHAGPWPRRGRAGRSSSSPPWNKVLLRCLRFLMPLYRKVKALAPRHRVATAATASPARGSGVEWCHGNADMAVHDAILYCKKSSVS